MSSPEESFTGQRLVEQSGLTGNRRMIAEFAIVGLKFLKGLSQKSGIPINDMTPEFIVAELLKE